MSMIIVTLFSLVGLIWSANHLVIGAAGIAYYYQISPLIIGLTVVAIATSAPEMMISLLSASNGQNDLALGNAIGSNIANIGLVLGLTILIRPLTLRASLLRREYPLLFIIMIFTYFLMIDGYLSVMDGCLLLLATIASIVYLLFLAKHAAASLFAKEFNQWIDKQRPIKNNILSLSIGCIILPLCAHFLVNSASTLTKILGISPLVAGLTVVSIGTCLPQLATSITAAFKGQDDIAVGNIIGSNMFNLLIVLIFPSLINPSAVNRTVLWRDMPIMFAITLVMVLINHQGRKKVSRWQGSLLILIYTCYLVSLVVKATPL